MSKIPIRLWTPSDLIAALALLIALPANIYLLWGWYEGAVVKRFTDITVAFRSYDGENNGTLSVTTITSSINLGKKGHDDIIVQEGVDILIGKRAVNMNAIFLVNISPIEDEGWIKGSYAPFSIKGGGETITNELLFYPSDVICRTSECTKNTTKISWSEFKIAIENLKKTDKITLTFWARLYSGNLSESVCEVSSPVLKSYINKQKGKNWVEVPCISQM